MDVRFSTSLVGWKIHHCWHNSNGAVQPDFQDPWCVSFDKLVAQTYEGAANISGCYNRSHSYSRKYSQLNQYLQHVDVDFGKAPAMVQSMIEQLKDQRG